MTNPAGSRITSGQRPQRRKDPTPGPWRTIAVTPTSGLIAIYRLTTDGSYFQAPVVAWFVQARHTGQGRIERVVCAVLDLESGEIQAVNHPNQNTPTRQLIAVGDENDVRALFGDATPQENPQ